LVEDFKNSLFSKGIWADIYTSSCGLDKSGQVKLRNWVSAQLIDKIVLNQIRRAELNWNDFQSIIAYQLPAHTGELDSDIYDYFNHANLQIEDIGEEKFRKFHGEKVWKWYQEKLEDSK
jgi:hypothetical protein